MESLREEQEIQSWELIREIARMTQPGVDPSDDAATLARLIEEAKRIVKGDV